MSQTGLEEAIAERIRREGSLGFDVFMEMALYDPDRGYYARGEAVTGRAGDFYTSVSVGSCFGEILAEQAVEIWERMGSPGEFHLVEQGANDGRLLEDLLVALEARQPDLLGGLECVIVEPFGRLREMQAERFEGWPLRWVPSMEELGGVRGVVLCNELVDAFPFRRIQMTGGEWREIRVGLDRDGQFAWETVELRMEDGEAAEELEFLGEASGEGTIREIRPAATRWARALAGALERGVALIVDYGYARCDVPGSGEGTLRCFRGHRASEDALAHAGEQDITAKVDFARLAAAGVEAGLEISGFTDQHHFLIGAAEGLIKEREGRADSQWVRQFQTLSHPGIMGMAFKVLGLQRGLDVGRGELRGFRHDHGEPL